MMRTKKHLEYENVLHRQWRCSLYVAEAKRSLHNVQWSTVPLLYHRQCPKFSNATKRQTFSLFRKFAEKRNRHIYSTSEEGPQHGKIAQKHCTTMTKIPETYSGL